MTPEVINISHSLAKENFVYCKDTMALKLKIEGSFVQLGKRLLEIKEKKRYRPNYDSFAEFLQEMKMDPATATKLMRIYEHFVINLKLPAKEIAKANDWSNVYEVIKVSPNKKLAKDWLNRIKELSRSDLRRELIEEKTGITEKNCKHEDSYSITICRRCGRREQIYDEKESEKK